MELENCINFLLSTAQHNVFQYLNSQLAEYGVTPAQYGVMNCLWKYRDLTPKQIGELLHLEASSVSGILERMQNNGLLERNRGPGEPAYHPGLPHAEDAGSPACH